MEDANKNSHSQFFISSLCLFFLVTALSFYGCGKKEAPKKDLVVAKVNNESIRSSDLVREIDSKKKNDPLFKVTIQNLDDQLQTVIEKRLLIQEAKKRRLDEKEKFIHTIKLFWEQTLIRDLVEAKEKELALSVSVSEEESKLYYKRISHQYVFAVVQSKKRSELEKLLDKNVTEIPWDRRMVAVSYDDVTSEVFKRGFDIAEGQMEIIQGEGQYYLIHVEKKIPTPIPSYETLKEEVRQKVTRAKVQGLFQEWFETAKKESRISTNRKALKEVQLKHA